MYFLVFLRFDFFISDSVMLFGKISEVSLANVSELFAFSGCFEMIGSFMAL